MAIYFKLSKEKVMAQLLTSVSGLNTEVIPSLQKKFGKNVLKEIKGKSRLSILLSQFTDVMILILIGAAVISFLMGEHTDAFVILAIILGNAGIGYSQEYSAEKTVRLLQQLSPQHALVTRNSSTVKILAADLLPGDIIMLQAGDMVPSDGRIIESNSFKTEESSLTGESQAIEKNSEPITGTAFLPGDQHNMIFRGTMVANGSAKAVVTAIGMETEIGKIAGLVQPADKKTPLQKKLSVFSKQLTVIIIIICCVIYFAGIWRGEDKIVMLLTALSLAVAALPETLPAVITIALSGAARRMAKENVLMRKLPAVETLGSVTFICSDKTGTLTLNKMTVEKIESFPGKDELLKEAMLVNNEVRFAKDKLMGDSTETALVQYALTHGLTKKETDKNIPRVETLPFDSLRMKMSTLHRYGDQWILFVKGAPAKIVESLSKSYSSQTEQLLKTNREWAAGGLRVLFFAYRVFDDKPIEVNVSMETELEFLGMVGMIDPVRPEVMDAIAQCKSAGIKTAMITGDQVMTAHAIARRLSMISEDASQQITGDALDKYSVWQWQHEIEHISVFARVTPIQKVDIVKSLQHSGHIVAMTGDGVNDSPSLKQSDIGVAMGITGTDVSKAAADMILLDDNFATIVKAIKEGRRIYTNIKKFIVYILSCNLAEILTIFLAPILGLGIPLLPVHILWINLVTDGLPGLALIGTAAEKNIMQLPPRSPKEQLFAGGMIAKIIYPALVITAAALIAHWWAQRSGYSIRMQQTMVFSILCFMQLVNAIIVSSNDQGFFSRSIFLNRKLWATVILTVLLQLIITSSSIFHSILKTNALELNAWIFIIVILAVGLCLLDLIKKATRK